MKRLISICILLLLMNPQELLAQKFYMKSNLGYSMATGPQSIVEFYDLIEENTGSIYIEQNKISLGQGLQTNLGFGYGINPNFALELNFSYFHGAKSKREIGTLDNYFEMSLRGRMISISPSIVLSSDKGYSDLSYYSRAGLIMGFGPSIVFLTQSLGERITLYEQRFILSGSSAYGFNGAFGVKKKFERLDLFLELDYRAISYTPSKMTMVKSTVNGDSNLDRYNTSEIETVFLDELRVDNQSSNNPSKASEALTSSFAFSSIGLNFGLSFILF